MAPKRASATRGGQRVRFDVLFRALKDDASVAWAQPNELRRALMVLNGVALLEHPAIAPGSFFPNEFGIARKILDVDLNDFAPKLPPPVADKEAPVAIPVVPANAIDGRWVAMSKPAPRSGANGEVYAVTDWTKVLAGTLAIKQLHERPTKEKLARFAKEIEALQKINHPNVLKVLASSLERARPYFVAKYYAQNLGDYLARSPKPSDADRLEVFIKICEGVQAAHDLNIVHRDLKPSNVLLSSKQDGNELRVGDFGICFVPGDERLTDMGEQMGPKKYMAPELRDGRLAESEIKPRVDVYALGKILYTMFVGKDLLFDRENFLDPKFEIVAQTGRDELAHLNLIFARTITEDPSQRFQNANEVAVEVRRRIPLIAGKYIIVGPKGGQRCMVCGLGRYQLDNNEFATLNTAGGVPPKILACDECGRVMIFRPTTAASRKRWGVR